MRYWPPLVAKTKAINALPHPENERQWSVNDSWPCTSGNLTGNWLQTSINEILAAFRGNNNVNTLPAPFWYWLSMEHQQSLVFHLGKSECHIIVVTHIRCAGSLLIGNSTWHMLPRHENHHQLSVITFGSCILGNQEIVQIYTLITELLTAFLGHHMT